MPSALPTAHQAAPEELKAIEAAAQAHQWPETGATTAVNKICAYKYLDAKSLAPVGGERKWQIPGTRNEII